MTEALNPDTAKFIGDVFDVMSAGLRETDHMLQDNIAQMAIGYVWSTLEGERQSGAVSWTYSDLMEIIERAREAVQKKLDLVRAGNTEEDVVP